MRKTYLLPLLISLFFYACGSSSSTPKRSSTPSASSSSAKKRNKSYEDYIDKYKSLAIHDMKEYKIPASITLAQGILESGAGLSSLSKKSNNHFGIKCHGWKGPSVTAKDDGPNDCFRKYSKVEDSYADHSRFLREKPRYKKLFDLDIKDYKGWAKGLQQCGYATDKAYANRLISIIENYELYEYDQKNGGKKKSKTSKTATNVSVVRTHTPYITGGLVYIVANEGDKYESIANEFKFKLTDLCEYNEVPKDYPLQKGDLIYFQKKKEKADKPYYEHVIQVGESMYSISQLYGIKVENLYKMNHIGMDDDFVPTEGDVLKLR